MDGEDRRTHSETLSTAVRLIRARRNLRTQEVAEAMDMPLRSYEHFEAGGGRVQLERIHRFAEAVDADPYALLAALALGSPRFAVRCADNKLMTILMLALQEFDAEVGDVIAEIDARTLINAFTRALRELGLQAVRRDTAAQSWIDDRLARLSPPGSPEAAE
jgi:transcriptional regulator with XRE-family HTH domain